MTGGGPGGAAIFTDTHAHLSYIADRPGEAALDAMLRAYTAASEAGSRAILVDPGVEAEDFAGRAERFGHLSFVRLAAGIWPSKRALDDPERALALLAPHAADIRCRAIGECGPDYHHMNASREAQRRLFEGQLALAESHRKPVIVHSRDAAADTIDIIAAAQLSVPVIIHCFGYGPAEAERFLSLGCMLSFAGNVTYKSASVLREACLSVPEERLLLETDAPYMNPLPARGKPSTSLDIERTYRYIAELRGTSPEALSALVARNARALFGG